MKTGKRIKVKVKTREALIMGVTTLKKEKNVEFFVPFIASLVSVIKKDEILALADETIFPFHPIPSNHYQLCFVKILKEAE